MNAKLLVTKEGVELQSVDLNAAGKSALSLGRGEGCDVRLSDRAVGREHALLLISSSGLVVQKKSKFGKMSVNGVEASESALKPGDVISIADYQLRLEALQESRAASADVQFEAPGADLEPLQPVSNPQVTHEPIGHEPELASPIGEGATKELSLGPIPEKHEPLALEEAPSVPSISAPVDLPPQEAAPNLADSGAFDGGGGEDRTAMVAQPNVAVKLIFKPGDANVEEFEIRKPEISVGRGTVCDIVLNDKKSSRKHLIIRRYGMSFVAKDLGSANGTYINGERFSERELAGDDVLRIGQTEFTFKALSQDYFAQEQEFMHVPAVESVPESSAGNMVEFEGAVEGQDVQAQFQGALQLSGDPNAITQQPTDPGAVGIAGLSTIPGMSGVSPTKKETLVEKFKRQPMVRKIMIVMALLGGLFVLLDDGDPKAQKKPETKTPVVTDKADAAFNALQPEKKQFVMNTYQLALDLYKNQEFEKSLFEAQKILDILPGGYKDTKDIKAYAQKAIEIQKSREEEKRRKEEEERIKREVAALVAQAQELVDKGRDDEAREVFSKVLEKDPENPTVLRLKQQLDDKDAQRRVEAENSKERERRRKELEALLDEGRKLLRQGKYYEVMARMQDAPLIGYNDEKMLKKAKNLIAQAKQALIDKTKPHLDEGEAALGQGDYPRARDAFLRALRVDPYCKQAKVGLEKIAKELHERAKKIYTDAVILESVSDYRGAKAKYKECLDASMPEDIYRGRCQRKYKRFDLIDRQTAGDSGLSPGSTNTDPQMPTVNAPVAEPPVGEPPAEGGGGGT